MLPPEPQIPGRLRGNPQEGRPLGPHIGQPGYVRQAPYCFPCYNGSTGQAFAPSNIVQRDNLLTDGYRGFHW